MATSEAIPGNFSTAILACGALAREIRSLIDRHGWSHMHLTCLPAALHNRPQAIPDRVDAALHDLTARFDRVLVGYADCGTGGALDRVLERHGVTRLPGAHCYDVFGGAATIAQIVDDEIGTFFLTDFLARQFETLIVKGLGIDRHPELLEMYFGNYRRLVYLAQTDDPELDRRARAGADRLGLAFERRSVGYGVLGDWLASPPESQPRKASPGKPVMERQPKGPHDDRTDA
ncbi:DUF1638 domain-containing protein [Fodinicurvata sp. EGI_FJ10296]|uniref:DUF1638 domain-containing protein n=1 Tax=Fodinicurvata sp. EGI_FJ10296 TaxID=3231908 RepID=UPI0034547A8B